MSYTAYSDPGMGRKLWQRLRNQVLQSIKKRSSDLVRSPLYKSESDDPGCFCEAADLCLCIFQIEDGGIAITGFVHAL